MWNIKKEINNKIEKLIASLNKEEKKSTNTYEVGH